MKKGAHFSLDRRYRYLLWRIWDSKKGLICFVGLNPSTANEKENDATIRRLIHFTEQQGYGGFYIVNLFSYRSRDFDDVKSSVSPIGIKTDYYIKKYARKSNLVCLIWGGKGVYLDRDKEVEMLIYKEEQASEIRCLGKTNKGNPKHPLYLPNTTKMVYYYD